MLPNLTADVSIGAIVTLIAIVPTAVYVGRWVGAISRRVEVLEAASTKLEASLERIRTDILREIRRHPVIRCPMAGDDRCAVRGQATGFSEEGVGE